MARKSKKTEPIVEITTFKGFDKHLKCRGFQYEIGGSYDNGSKRVVRCAEHGFHACEHPLDVLSYYPPVDGNRYAIVTQSGQIDRAEGEDTKIASAKITINTEISLGEFGRGIAVWFAKIFAGIPSEKETMNTAGYRAHANTAGNYAHACVKGKNSIASAPGIRSTASAGEGGAIMLAAYDEDWNLVAVRSSMVGQNGIEAGKKYRLLTNGEFEEVAE